MRLSRFFRYFHSLIKTEKGSALADPEQDNDDIPDDASLAILRGLAEQANATQGEILSDHRTRFEERRREYEVKLGPNPRW